MYARFEKKKKVSKLQAGLTDQNPTRTSLHFLAMFPWLKNQHHNSLVNETGIGMPLSCVGAY